MNATHSIRFMPEAPQLSQAHKKRSRLFTSCDNCRQRRITCIHVTSQSRCEACEASNLHCQFRDRRRYSAERSHIVTGTSAAPSLSHSLQPPSSLGIENSALPSPARGDSVDASGCNIYLGVPTSSDSGHPLHYAFTSPLSPLLSSPRSNPDQSFPYPFFGPAPCAVIDDQIQQLEGVPRLLHSFRPPAPPRPPERLHPTLSSWLKNMNKFSDLVDRMQELASAAPMVHRPRLHRQVATLRATSRRKRGRCIEFLRLAEEYVNRHLLDISAEIQQQSSFLDMLEKRLDMARTLYNQAVDLRKSYALGTASAMMNVRNTELSRPLPEDFDLFNEVDFALGEIQRCYIDLDKFWVEEICRAVKALETRRVDPDDVKRWRGLKASLEQTVELWKMNCDKQGSSIWSALLNNRTCSSGADLGAILSTLSPALSTLERALHNVRESASVESSHIALAFILRANLGFTQNRDMCLAFFRRCLNFGEVIAASSITLVTHPSFSRVRASDDLQGRVVFIVLETEAADVPPENVTQSQGSRKFNSAYAQCLCLQRRTTLELNALLECVSSWIVVADGLPDARPGGFSLKLLHDLADAWAKERASIRMVLATLTNDPVERLRCRSLSMVSTRPRFSVIRWIMDLVS